MTAMTNTDIKKELEALADSKYKKFHSALLPGIENILGVRVPLLRTLAKKLVKQDDWRTFLENTNIQYYEETMLQGMVIALAQMDPDERLQYIRLFVPHIDNWAICDIFCGELKTIAWKEKERLWQFIQPYLVSEQEFEIRFGIVMLFHYIDESHISQLLTYADQFGHEAYYARMAMAWMISICFIKFPEQTMEYLKHSKLDNWTFNKAIQKTVESLRIDQETKGLLKSMKRR